MYIYRKYEPKQVGLTPPSLQSLQVFYNYAINNILCDRFCWKN